MQSVKINTSWGPSRAGSLTPPRHRQVLASPSSPRRSRRLDDERGPCWCASTYRRKGYSTLSSPPYYDLCPQRCWRLSSPSATPHNRSGRESNLVGSVYSECGNTTSSSYGKGAIGELSEIRFKDGEPRASRNSIETLLDVNNLTVEEVTGRLLAWHERPNSGRGDWKTA